MNWKAWIYGLAHAVIGGAANSAGTILVDPARFNLTSKAGFLHVLEMAAIGGFISFWLYLKQSPLPDTPGATAQK